MRRLDAKGQPLRILGEGVGRTVLKGTEAVPDAWTLHSGHIYKQQLPPHLQIDSRQLFIDGQWVPEARWPNVALVTGSPATAPGGPLSLDSWAVSANATDLRSGVIVDPKLPRTNWTGALATLNVGFRFLTWTRRVLSHNATAFQYDSTEAQYGHVGGSGAYLNKGGDNLYFLSGVLGALDSPGEYFIDQTTWMLYLWAPDSQPPGARVEMKVRDYCVDLGADPLQMAVGAHSLSNLSLHGCTFRLQGCAGCDVSDVELAFPSYTRDIAMRDVVAGPAPPHTVLEGNHSSVQRLHVRYANDLGLKVVGSHNRVADSLFEDFSWLGTLDFPGVELGFGARQPTLASAARGADDELPHGRIRLGGSGDMTVGNDNVLERLTVQRFSSMGVLTSQRSNEVAHSHIRHGGLTGLDSACLHADNTYVSCMNYSIPAAERANCTKRWHHNWVHDCREKCVRGDDRNLNLTVDHSVVWNCGIPLYDRNDSPALLPPGKGAATGVILKGDYNRYYANTVFNTSVNGQGDLCAVTSAIKFPALPQQNAHS